MQNVLYLIYIYIYIYIFYYTMTFPVPISHLLIYHVFIILSSIPAWMPYFYAALPLLQSQVQQKMTKHQVLFQQSKARTALAVGQVPNPC